jgi:hypothetical protein
MTAQDAYELYCKKCHELWKLEPAPIEVYEKTLGSVTPFGGNIAAVASSRLARNGT